MSARNQSPCLTIRAVILKHMLNHQAGLDRAFHALADPTRRAIVERLAREPASVSALARPLAMSLPAVMQHLAVLEASGLVRSEKSGRVRMCRVEPEALSLAERWINDRRTEWENRLDRLGDYLSTLANSGKPMNESAAKTMKPVQVSRTFHASRQRVFTAWSSAEAVKRWFAPTGFTVPEARVELAVGGPFEVLMRSPTGEEHWARGVVREVSAFERLVIDFTIEEPNGRALFRALTEVNFSDTLGGTRLDATQSYTVIDPDAAWMPEGAPQGWAQTLDNLAEEVLRIEAKRSVSHGVFSVERAYDVPVERVWRALTDREAKAKWFGGIGRRMERDRASHGLSRRRRRAPQGPLDKRRRLRLRRASTTTSFPIGASSTAIRCASTRRRSPSRSPRWSSSARAPAGRA